MPSEKNSPTFSACIPNYNHALFLPEVLRSILEQSRRPLEVLVLDDGSTDNSVEVVEHFAKEDTIVRLERNDRNRGVVYTLNRCVSLARGEFVHCLAADDWILPGFYERSARLLAAHPNADISCTPCVQFDDSSQNKSYPFSPWSVEPRYFTPDELILVKSNGHIISQTVLMRRSGLLKAGGFRPELRWHCDWFINWVVAFRSGICHVPEPLAVMRMVESSYSRGTLRWEEQRMVLDRLLSLLKDPQYLDVQPYFSRSGILFSLNDRQAVVRAALENPEHCDPMTRGLIVEMLEKNYGRDPGPTAVLHEDVKPDRYSRAYLAPKVNRLVERWNAAGKRVVIYGAGEHTARLFQWTTLSQARLIGLVDSNTTLHGQVRWDLKIHPPEQIRNLNPDVILISSQMWQEEIYRSLAPLESAGIEVVRLYQP